MKKIGCFIHSPASANNVHALIKELKKIYNVEVFTFHSYAQNLLQTNECYTHEELNDLFDTFNFDLILTGTGSMHPVEEDVPKIAKEKNIPCISIIDAFWMDDNNLQYRFKNVPDYITAPNEDIKSRLINLLNIDESRVLAIGIPHLDRLKNFMQKKNYVEDPKVVSFFSTCSTNGDYSDTHPLAKKALRELSRWVDNHSFVEKVMVTKHPREDGKWISSFCLENPKFIFSTEPSWDLLLKSCIVFGIPSALLYEAQIINKKAVIFEKDNDIHLFKLKDNQTKKNYVSSLNATEKLISFIHNLLK